LNPNHANRGRLVVTLGGPWRLYQRAAPPGWVMLGTVQTGAQIGALGVSARGIYAQLNAGQIHPINQRKFAAIFEKRMAMLKITNNGPELADTNYWDSEHAAAGLFFLTWNAGAGRLLVPDSRMADLKEMRTAQYVIVSRGPWPERKKAEGIELLFEDHSNSPYCLHLSIEQTDRLLPDIEQGGGFKVVAWTRKGRAAEWPGKYRKVPKIPCLEPWSVQ
jgi:hypothetical protein